MSDQQPPPSDLSHAGAVVDKAIEYMTGQDIGPLAIASALLGAAVSLLARSLPPHHVVQILNNAAASVQAGEVAGGGAAPGE